METEALTAQRREYLARVGLPSHLHTLALEKLATCDRILTEGQDISFEGWQRFDSDAKNAFSTVECESNGCEHMHHVHRKTTAARDVKALSTVFVLPSVAAYERRDVRRVFGSESAKDPSSADALFGSKAKNAVLAALFSPGVAADHIADSSAIDDFWCLADVLPLEDDGQNNAKQGNPHTDGALKDSSLWCLPPPPFRFARHSDVASIAVALIPSTVASTSHPRLRNASLGIPMYVAWPIADIAAGDDIFRNWMPSPVQSAQRITRLCVRLERCPALWPSLEHAHAYNAVAQSAAGSPLPGSQVDACTLSFAWNQNPSFVAPVDPRIEKGIVAGDIRTLDMSLAARVKGGEQLRVWTDYDRVADSLTDSRFAIVTDPALRDSCDVVVTPAHVKSFVSLGAGQLIFQFPYEASLVRKDILPQTLRAFCRVRSEGSVDTADAVQWQMPPYFLPSYDIATEVQFFVREHDRRCSLGGSSRWIVKPGDQARCIGHFLTSCKAEAARAVERGGEWVAQEYVERPMLLKGRKFDIRFYAIVRSFHTPFEAYLYRGFYTRVADKAYNLSDDTLSDAGMHFTVFNYAAGAAQLFMSAEQTASGVAESTPDADIDWMSQAPSSVFEKVRKLASLLFRGAGHKIGQWPLSRGYYGFDVILSHDGTPHVLEVNYYGDLTRMLNYYPSFVNEMVAALVLNECTADAMAPL